MLCKLKGAGHCTSAKRMTRILRHVADMLFVLKVPMNDVELLVMKALSLGLVRGSIDEVDRCVHMTWVQPRVLDKAQIGNMKDKMADWYAKVFNMEKLVEVKAHDILT